MFIQLRDTPCSSALAGFTRFGLQLPASKKQNTPCPSCVGGVRELRCRNHENVHTCVSGRLSRSLFYYGDTLPSPCRLFIREWPPQHKNHPSRRRRVVVEVSPPFFTAVLVMGTSEKRHTLFRVEMPCTQRTREDRTFAAEPATSPAARMSQGCLEWCFATAH